MKFFSLFSVASITEGFAPIWCQCSKFFCKLSFAFALFLKISKSKSWESISNSSGKEWKGDKKVHLCLNKIIEFSEISSIGQLLRQCLMWETGFDGYSETDD